MQKLGFISGVVVAIAVGYWTLSADQLPTAAPPSDIALTFVDPWPTATTTAMKSTPTWMYRRCESPEEVAKVLSEMPAAQAAAAKITPDPRDGSFALFFTRRP